MTLILDGQNESDLNKASELLKNKKLVALPTETVYGLAANGLDKIAVENIFKAKGRPSSNPLILHVKCLEDAKKLYGHLSNKQKNLLEKLAFNFWPGPLTIVAPKNSLIPNNITANKTSVAVRVPAHELTLKILAKIDFPLAMPSANLSSRPSPTSALHVLNTLKNKIDAVLDGGLCKIGIESTVISLMEDKPKILRPGSVTQDEISYILGEEIFIHQNIYENPECPGLSFLHYAPKVKQVILINEDEIKNYWQSSSSILLTKTQYEKSIVAFNERSKKALSLILNDDINSFAKNLYNALYEAEKYPEEILAIVKPNDDHDWIGVNDRLKRSAGQLHV